MFCKKRAEGNYYPNRTEHLLTCLVQLLIHQMAAKVPDISYDDLDRHFSNPELVRFSKRPLMTEQEVQERSQQKDRMIMQSLMCLAGKDKTKEISREEFRSKYGV